MANKVEFQTRELQLTDKIKAHVNKKAGNLDHYLPAIEEAHINFTYHKSARNTADRHVVEVTARGKGVILRTEERADEPLSAFDAAFDHMQRQIERYKGKHYHNNKRSAARSADNDSEAAEPVDETGELPALIARRKQFRLLPMNEEEAIEQMTLLGHDNFFIFYNGETGKINVLYRRRDGSYGLIESEMG
jgi:putative sigma-54 modulation protein